MWAGGVLYGRLVICLFMFLGGMLHSHSHTRTYTHTHARTHVCVHTRTHALTLTRTHTQTHARARIYTRTHARTHTRAHTHTHALTHTRTLPRTYARTHKRRNEEYVGSRILLIAFVTRCQDVCTLAMRLDNRPSMDNIRMGVRTYLR